MNILKKANFIISILLVCAGISLARNAITWNLNAENWVKKFKSGHNNQHRSGLLNETDKTFDESASISELPDGEKPESKKASAHKWRKGALAEYLVINSKPNSKMVTFLKKKCLKKLSFTEEQYNENEGVLTLSKVPKEIPFDELSYSDIKPLVNKARKLIKKHLNPLKGRVEYENYQTEFVTIDGQDKVNKIRIRFRRIFKGSIVLRNVSYVYFILDGHGNPISLQIKWPRFELVSEGFDYATISEGFTEAIQHFENLEPYITNTEGEKEVNISHADITGAALGWYPLEEENRLIITPVYSFLAKCTLENGDKVDDIFDYPVFTKHIE